MKRILLILIFLPHLINAQTISTVAGCDTCSFLGDGGPATSAGISACYGIALDASGNIYIADEYNNRIRKVSITGVITTVAGTGYINICLASGGYSGDGGPAILAKLNHPMGVAVDDSGNIYISDYGNQRVRKVNTLGIITTIAGNGTVGYSGDGGAATACELYFPLGLATDHNGNVYISDNSNNAIRKVNNLGIITTIAGTGATGFSGDGGPATDAMLNSPWGIAADNAGNIYIADEENGRIRKVSTTGMISTIVGNGTMGFGGDGGRADSAELNLPGGVGVDAGGNIYVADQDNSRIRKVTPAGIITTIAGNGIAGNNGDGSAPIDAELDMPADVVIDGRGNVYIAEELPGIIRKISSPTTSVANITQQNKMTIFPNPATNILTVMVSGAEPQSTNEPISQISITNLMGQTVYSQQSTANCQLLTVNCSAFPPGVYFIKINGTEARKFIKE